MLTGLVPGRYLFKLTVTDDAGASSSDTASIIIKPGMLKFDNFIYNLFKWNLMGKFHSETDDWSLALLLALVLWDTLENIGISGIANGEVGFGVAQLVM